MRLQALAAALGLMAASLTTERATALSIPESLQPVIVAVGWQPADIPTLVEVIRCESGWNTQAMGASGEIGLLQLHPQTFTGLSRVDEAIPPLGSGYEWSPSVNLYAGRVLHDAESWGPWDTSRGCWG